MIAKILRKIFFGFLIYLCGAYTIGSVVLVVAAPFMAEEGAVILIVAGIVMTLLFGWLTKKAWRAYKKPLRSEPEAQRAQTKTALPDYEPSVQEEPNAAKESFPERMPDFAAAVSLKVETVEQDAEVPVPKGAEISYLDAEAIKFWNKKRTDVEVPAYYQESAFGRNAVTALPRLLDAGYLELGDLRQRISLKTVPELKAILADRELKVSGKKQELIQRLLDHVDSEELEELFPVGVYRITEKGEQAVEPYEIIEDNNRYGLGLSYYRVMKEKEACPHDSHEEIFLRLLSEDMQRYYKDKNELNFQSCAEKMARLRKEMGDYDKAFELYALAFFIWSKQAVILKMPSDDPQIYYMAKNLEEAGRLCGYDFEKALSMFQEAIKKHDPFGLATNLNVSASVRAFKKALGIS